MKSNQLATGVSIIKPGLKNQSKQDAPEHNLDCLTQGSEYLSKKNSVWYLIHLQNFQKMFSMTEYCGRVYGPKSQFNPF